MKLTENEFRDGRNCKGQDRVEGRKNAMDACYRIDFSTIAETIESVEDGQLWNHKGSIDSSILRIDFSIIAEIVGCRG